MRLAELWVVNRDLKASDFPSISWTVLLVEVFVDDATPLEEQEGPATSKKKQGTETWIYKEHVFKFELKTRLLFAFTLHMSEFVFFYYYYKSSLVCEIVDVQWINIYK